MNNEIYLDCAATSPLTEFTKNHLIEIFSKKLGNSSSIHHSGVISNLFLEKARIKISNLINCRPEEIYFTSGATESNNIVFNGILENWSNNVRNEILISSIEHSSVAQSAAYLSSKGFVVRKIPVLSNGEINFLDFTKLINEKTILVSIVHANSEIGVIQNLDKIGDICRNKSIFFHSDGAQAFCKTKVDVKKSNLDFYSISGHKIHSPKGVGALYINSNVKITPLFHGGMQEAGMRPGTTPVELIDTFAKASDQYTDEHILKLKQLYNELKMDLLNNFPGIRFHSTSSNQLPNIINFAIPGILGKTLLKNLDKRGVRVSVGSACNSGKKTASETLLAIGLTEESAFEAIRVSWGLETSLDDIKKFVTILLSITSES
jgi:cysteine desulfurase